MRYFMNEELYKLWIFWDMRRECNKMTLHFSSWLNLIGIEYDTKSTIGKLHYIRGKYIVDEELSWFHERTRTDRLDKKTIFDRM